MEAIEVPPIRIQSGHFHMHGVGQFRSGNRRPAVHDLLHRFVVCDFPADFDVLIRHAPAMQRIRCQTRPDHKSVRRRIARGDTEREWIIDERHLLLNKPVHRPTDQREKREGRGRPQEVPAIPQEGRGLIGGQSHRRRSRIGVVSAWCFTAGRSFGAIVTAMHAGFGEFAGRTFRARRTPASRTGLPARLRWHLSAPIAAGRLGAETRLTGSTRQNRWRYDSRNANR